MERIRLPTALLIIWLFFFYNIERLSKHINFSTMAYIMVPVVVAVIVLFPGLNRVNLWMLLTVPILVFLVVEIEIGTEVWGADTLLILTEICSIAVTTILARWVSIGVTEFENAVTNMTLGRGSERRMRQGEIYREVQRARAHHRPLALIALRADKTSVKIAIDRIVQEAQQAMIKQYVLGGVSKTLIEALPDYNIVARHNDHLLIVLPEVTPEQLPGVVDQLRAAVSRQVSVSLQVGTASLPADATTLESLMAKAVKDMEAEPESVQWPQRSPASLALENMPPQEDPNGHRSR